jgi:hypothetical protein
MYSNLQKEEVIILIFGVHRYFVRLLGVAGLWVDDSTVDQVCHVGLFNRCSR